MRVVPGSTPSSTLSVGDAPVPERKKFLEFRDALRSRLPENERKPEWAQFRRLARAVFGQSAFLPKRKGEDFQRLNLGASQLRHLAEHPGKVAKAIQTLQAKGKFDKKDDATGRAKLYAQTARKVVGTAEKKTATFTVATINDDFTDRKTNVPDVKATVKLVQEAKNTHLRKALKGDGFGVHQHRTDTAKKGSAVVWDKDRARSTDRGFALGVTPQGRKMETRYITWSDVVIDGVKVRVASAHRPPARFKALWDDFDKNLARFVKSTRGPLIIGMDSNTRDHRKLERMTGLRWEGKPRDIDGFLVSPGIKVDRLREGPKRDSDHNPVIARFRVTQR